MRRVERRVKLLLLFHHCHNRMAIECPRLETLTPQNTHYLNLILNLKTTNRRIHYLNCLNNTKETHKIL